MVWIHGGGHQWGSGAIYGADRLARLGDVVVVTLNYRLAVFGFLAHPALDRLANHGAGNLGVEDQQAALRWVRRNVGAFGGDSRNVTIFGQSAGALANCVHLTAPGSRGLFARVILQSGPCTMKWPYGQTPRAKPRAEAEAIALAVAEKAGCANLTTALSCLRSKSAQELLAADNSEHGHGPSFGGNGVVPDDPAELIARGRFAGAPVLHGTTRDEHVTFQVALDLFTGPIPPAEFGPTLGQLLGLDHEQAARVMARYPLSAYAGSTHADLRVRVRRQDRALVRRTGSSRLRDRRIPHLGAAVAVLRCVRGNTPVPVTCPAVRAADHVLDVVRLRRGPEQQSVPALAAIPRVDRTGASAGHRPERDQARGPRRRAQVRVLELARLTGRPAVHRRIVWQIGEATCRRRRTSSRWRRGEQSERAAHTHCRVDGAELAELA